MAINYTKIDQDEVRSELILLLKNTKTFQNANFVGTVLYDLANVLSYNASLFGFYLNQIANEPFIDTSKQYKNINRIANSLLYNPIGKGSARVAIASKLSKQYTLSNTEGYIEIPTFSQFPSTKISDTGGSFAFTNEKPLIVQVQQFGVSFIKETDIKYLGDIIANDIDPGQIILEGQKKKPVQIVETDNVSVIEKNITSIRHDTLSNFILDTEYSMIIQKVVDKYLLVIYPRTIIKLDNEILRFKINNKRQFIITQNFSQNKIYLGRLGFRNLVNTKFNVIKQIGNPNAVGRVQFVIPQYSPAFEILINGEIFSFSSNTEDIIISSNDLEQGLFDTNEDINIIISLTDLNSKYFGSKLILKKNSEIVHTDIIIGIISATDIVKGNVISSTNNSFLTGNTKSGSVHFTENDIAKRIVFDEPYDFGLETEEIPLNSSKNYSIFLYTNDNVKTFYTTKTTNGFVINIEPETGFSGTVFWRSVEYQRTNIKEEIIDINGLQGLFDITKEYAIVLQAGLNVLTWTSDITKSGFKILSDTSFVGDVDYLILPEKDFSLVDNPKLSGTEYISKGETQVDVKFEKILENSDYQLFLQPEDNVNVWFINKTNKGFTLNVEESTGFIGKVDWQAYISELSGTVTFGGGDLFVDQIDVKYQDLSETSNLGFVTQGLVKLTQIDESGLFIRGLNGLNLSYDTDTTINPGLSFVIEDLTISYNNIRVFSKIKDTWVEFEQIDNFKSELTSLSKIFYIRINKDKKISLKFGNNDSRGYDPIGGKIVILGMECVGKDGNIGENILDKEIIGSLNFQTSNLVTSDVEVGLIDLIKVKRDSFFANASTSFLLDYKNKEITLKDLSIVQIGTGIFGTEPENIESIRKNAQLSHKTQDRLITITDYQTLVKNQFNDFIIDLEVFNFKEAKQIGILPQGEDERNFFNTLFFMMIPAFGTSFSLFQRESINSYLDNKAKRIIGVNTQILEPTFIPIDVIISFSHKIDASPIQIRNNISNGVFNYFKRLNRSLGEIITTESVRNEIIMTDITQLNMMLKRDQNNTYTANDYDVDIKPTEFQDAFAEVETQKLNDVIKKEIRNLVGKGLIELKQPLFDVQQPSGDRNWQFTGDVQLSRFEFPVLGDLVIERKV